MTVFVYIIRFFVGKSSSCAVITIIFIVLFVSARGCSMTADEIAIYEIMRSFHVLHVRTAGVNFKDSNGYTTIYITSLEFAKLLNCYQLVDRDIFVSLNTAAWFMHRIKINVIHSSINSIYHKWQNFQCVFRVFWYLISILRYTLHVLEDFQRAQIADLISYYF